KRTIVGEAGLEVIIIADPDTVVATNAHDVAVTPGHGAFHSLVAAAVHKDPIAIPVAVHENPFQVTITIAATNFLALGFLGPDLADFRLAATTIVVARLVPAALHLREPHLATAITVGPHSLPVAATAAFGPGLLAAAAAAILLGRLAATALHLLRGLAALITLVAALLGGDGR
ncbi:MAG TPA: hypothetical protein VFZ35_02345, partial [Sphingomicrobium sp.]